MPIKLLHHKSWHVWKGENIAKVKLDEHKHEEEQKRKRKKKRKNEAERRLKKLREEADAKDVSSSSSALEKSHVNFFELEEQQQYGKTKGNEEHEKEEKERKERELRKLGIAPKRLGGREAERKEAPWYSLGPKEEAPKRGAFGQVLDAHSAQSRLKREDARKQNVFDPMKEMERMLARTKAIEREYTDHSERMTSYIENIKMKKSKKKKEKDHKDKSRKKDKRDKSKKKKSKKKKKAYDRR